MTVLSQRQTIESRPAVRPHQTSGGSGAEQVAGNGLQAAYSLKEDLSQIWQQSPKALAAWFLTDWCRRARASGIKVLITMANTLEGHRNGMLN